MNDTIKRALVTGGSGGLGQAICRRLAADGLHVIVHANGNPDRAESVVADIVASGLYITYREAKLKKAGMAI